MEKEEFNKLYANKEFRNKLKKICKSMFAVNQAAFNRGGFFNHTGGESIEYTPAWLELQQECLIKIWYSAPGGKSISYYLKTAQNCLLDIFRKYSHRCDLVEIVYPGHKTPQEKALWNEFYSTAGGDDFTEDSYP